MFKLNPLSLISGSCALTIASFGYFFNYHSVEAVIIHNQNHDHSSHHQSSPLMLASAWDQVSESYKGNKQMTVYRSASCGCCGAWIQHMEKHGFKVKEIITEDLEAIKNQYNLPLELSSCHTAIIDGYVIEGHIPANDVKRFLTQKPDVLGITVPGMPIGTPGMEARDIKQPFEILTFDNQGKTTVFNSYDNY